MSKFVLNMLRLPKFDRKQEKFDMNDMQIKAYLLVKGMAGILDKEFWDKLPTKKDAVPDPTKQTRKKNSM